MFGGGRTRRVCHVVDHSTFTFVGGLGSNGRSTCDHFVTGTAFLIRGPHALIGVIRNVSTLSVGGHSAVNSICRCMLNGVTTSNGGKRFHAPHRVVHVVITLVRPALRSDVYSPTVNSTKFVIRDTGCIRRRCGARLLGHRRTRRCGHKLLRNFSASSAVLHVNTVGLVLRKISGPSITCGSDLSASGASRGGCALYLTGPPFTNDLSCSTIDGSLLTVAGAGGARLLFVTLFIHVLRVNNHYTDVIPSNMLFNADAKRVTVHGRVISGRHLRTIVSVPDNIFGPCTKIDATVLVFAGAGTKNASGI